MERKGQSHSIYSQSAFNQQQCECLYFLTDKQSMCSCQNKYCYDLPDIGKPSRRKEENKQRQHPMQDYICSKW